MHCGQLPREPSSWLRIYTPLPHNRPEEPICGESELVLDKQALMWLNYCVTSASTAEPHTRHKGPLFLLAEAGLGTHGRGPWSTCVTGLRFGRYRVLRSRQTTLAGEHHLIPHPEVRVQIYREVNQGVLKALPPPRAPLSVCTCAFSGALLPATGLLRT